MIRFVNTLVLLSGLLLIGWAIDIQVVCDLECNYYSESINYLGLILGMGLCFLHLIIDYRIDKLKEVRK